MAVVYGRQYDDQVLSFEPSGALWEASLVMRDRETDSWWSIITGDAIGGGMKGRKLEELTVGEKVRWGEWRKRHPDSLVLSVDGLEHDPGNPYVEYFSSDRTFQNIEVLDSRLPGKKPVFAFELEGFQFAVPHAAIEGGAVFSINDREVFLYRSEGADLFQSTRAYIFESASSGGAIRMQRRAGHWVDSEADFAYDEENGFGDESVGVGRLPGFDTFWYNFANIISGSMILDRSEADPEQLEIQP